MQPFIVSLPFSQHGFPFYEEFPIAHDRKKFYVEDFALMLADHTQNIPIGTAAIPWTQSGYATIPDHLSSDIYAWNNTVRGNLWFCSQEYPSPERKLRWALACQKDYLYPWQVCPFGFWTFVSPVVGGCLIITARLTCPTTETVPREANLDSFDQFQSTLLESGEQL